MMEPIQSIQPANNVISEYVPSESSSVNLGDRLLSAFVNLSNEGTEKKAQLYSAISDPSTVSDPISMLKVQQVIAEHKDQLALVNTLSRQAADGIGLLCKS